MSVAEIDALLKNNPEVIKQSIETSMKLQAAILKYVNETGKKVICDTAECLNIEDVPKDLPILSNNGRIQYLNIQILDDDADDDYVKMITDRLKAFEDLYVNFDGITAEAIINIDKI